MRLLSLILFLSPFYGLAQANLEKQIQAEFAKLKEIQNQEALILDRIEALKLQKIQADLKQWGLPRYEADEEVIFHSAMALAYAEEHEQAKWVAHIVLPDIITGNHGRSNDFRPDEKIKAGSAVEEDYFLKELQTDGNYIYDGFGYDRGHLAPSADFRWSKQALSESYYYSNMAPQVADLNRERWAELEDFVRQYVIRNQRQVYVVTGGILKDDLPKIERSVNEVSVPEYFYKVILDQERQKAIAFVMPNRLCDYPLISYACSIDSVERLTGLDFFPNLPDRQEAETEANYDYQAWACPCEEEEAAPLQAESLPRDHFNTVQARIYADRGEEVNICGKVVSTKLSGKGNVFLNLDKKFPNQIFTVSIFKDRLVNFSYLPHEALEGKTICVKGKISMFNGTPSMIIENEQAIKIWEAE